MRILSRIVLNMNSLYMLTLPIVCVCPAQKRFEDDLKRIWTRAGLKKAPEGWSAPKIFIKQHGNKRD